MKKCIYLEMLSRYFGQVQGSECPIVDPSCLGSDCQWWWKCRNPKEVEEDGLSEKLEGK